MVLAIVALSIAIYANSLANGFAYDDVPIIMGNARVHQLRDQGAIWLTPYWANYGPQLGLYRPLTIFLYAVQWAISGGAPWVFHLLNIALHAGVTVLVFLLLTRLASRPAALAGAVLFAVHPVHTEAVANVVGQAELVGALAVLAACVVWAGRGEGPRVPAGRLAAVLALYAVALGAKESTIVLPGLLVILDVAQRRVAVSWKAAVRYLDAMIVPMVLLGAIAGGYLLLRLDVLGTITAANAAPSLPFLREEHRILNAFRAWPEYARLLFFPKDLSADYSPAVILPVESVTPMVLLGIMLLAGTTLLAACLPRFRGALAAAWFLIAILPVSNLFFPVGILVAERTLYLPSLAVSVAAAHLWDAAYRAGTPRRQWIGIAVVAALALLGGIRVIDRNPAWKDTLTVLLTLLRDHPESYRSHWFMGSQLMVANDTVVAEDHWTLAHRLWPRDAQLVLEWGLRHLEHQNYERAAELLEKANAMSPGVPLTLANLASAYLRSERYGEALAVADSLSGVTGPTSPVLELRARALAGLGRHEAAIATLRSAMRQRDDRRLWDQWRLLAESLAALGRRADAAAALDSAARSADGDTAAARRVAETREQLISPGGAGRR